MMPVDKLKAHREACAKYRASEKGKNSIYNYNHSERNRLGHAIRNKKYEQTKKGMIVRKKICEKFSQSEKGKIKDAKVKAKRKRNLNWILMFDNPFDDSEKIDYHHITDAYVVAIPRKLHQLYGGKYHRERVMEIVKQIYLE